MEQPECNQSDAYFCCLLRLLFWKLFQVDFGSGAACVADTTAEAIADAVTVVDVVGVFFVVAAAASLLLSLLIFL